ncbi:MAG: MgtC/SapB family protein [bacterium]|nr:MgtC/SapB family protein [bacterium]
MLTLEEMLIRLGVAILLGAIIGWEREMAGKEAGIRTDIVVSAGAALFAIASIALPYLTTLSPDQAMQAIIQNSAGLRVVSNVVVGIGFLGAGIIIHQGSQVRGLTTAASVWFVAAVGVLAGIGMTQFAIISATSITLLLLILRKIDLYGIVEKEREAENKKVGSRK